MPSDGASAVALQARVAELEKALENRDKVIVGLTRRLEASEASRAAGQLAAGIAHEVNTPTQYVTDNVSFLQRAFDKLWRLLEAQDQLLQAEHVVGEATLALGELRKSIKLDYLSRQVPRAIAQSLEGLGQISSIVRAMKEFSHPSGAEKQPCDLHEVIESATVVCKNEWKYVADLELDFDWSLPAVPLLRNELSQVMLNLIVNAAHAIAEATPEASSDKGKIVISTRSAGQAVEVRVSDTGTGIPVAAQPHVFEPFFTTKPVGRGSGQGLPIARKVITEKHGGTITFETTPGEGSTFIITIPLGSGQSA